MSALTPVYSSTPSPLGRPGGPGLWRVEGLKLPDYIENVARGIMEGGEADKSRAIATAIAAVKRWAAGGGKVTPEVRAAAAKAVAEWEALKASAHSHTSEGGASVDLDSDLGDAIALSWNAALHPRIAAGSSTGGQFGSGSGAPPKTAAGKGAKPKAASAKATAAKASAMQRSAALKRIHALRARANADRAKAHQLQAQIRKLNSAVAAGVTAATATKAKAAASKAAGKKITTKKRKAATTAKKTAKKATSTTTKATAAQVSQMRAAVGGLRTKVHSLLAQANALDKQAAAIKLASDDGSGRFLEMAFSDALTERVPPGVPEGGQFAAKPTRLGRYDTPRQAAAVINGMEPQQRAVVRQGIQVPPGFEWTDADRLAVAG